MSFDVLQAVCQQLISVNNKDFYIPNNIVIKYQ